MYLKLLKLLTLNSTFNFRLWTFNYIVSPNSPEFLFLALVLPSLFALTLIAEGTWKLMRDEPGWVSIVIGVGFLVMIVGAYFLLF